MTPLEDHLRHALAREPAPPGFEARLARRLNRRPPYALLAAAVLLMGLGTGGWIQHQRRLEAERASAQLLLALEISSEKLNHAFRRLEPAPEHP